MTKRPRLSDFGDVSHVTARVLAQVLRQVREEGLPNAVSTSSIRRHRREDLRRETDIGDLLQEVPVVLASGGEGSMWVQHTLAMLATVAADIAEVAELIAEMRELHIVMYSDEITPGQQIKGNDRKCQTVYWSLVNFGPELLCFESMWFTAAALRVSECKKIQGLQTNPSLVLRRSWAPRLAPRDLASSARLRRAQAGRRQAGGLSAGRKWWQRVRPLQGPFGRKTLLPLSQHLRTQVTGYTTRRGSQVSYHRRKVMFRNLNCTPSAPYAPSSIACTKSPKQTTPRCWRDWRRRTASTVIASGSCWTATWPSISLRCGCGIGSTLTFPTAFSCRRSTRSSKNSNLTGWA